MESLFELLSYMGIFAIIVPILSICLLWLFIRSAVASGTKHGIIDAYNQLSGKQGQQQINDFDAEMKGWE